MTHSPTRRQARARSKRVGIVRKGLARELGWGALAMLVLPSATTVVTSALTGLQALPPLVGTVLLGSVLAAPAMAAAALAVGRARPWRPGVLCVDEHGVAIKRQRRHARFARERVANGWLVPRHTSYRVEIDLTDGDSIQADVPDRRIGEALLAAAGVGAGQRRHAVRLGSATGAAVRGLGVAAAGFVGLLAVLGTRYPGAQPAPAYAVVGAVLTWLGLSGLALAALLYGPRRPRVVVGADGLAISTLFGSRFVPYAQIAYAEDTGAQVRLRLRDNSVLPIGRPAPRHDRDAAEVRAALVLRVREAMAAATATASAAARLTLLDRDARPLPAWREALRELVRRAASYREVHLSLADVQQVLEDPHSPPERRIAAALALAVSGDAQAPTRIRAAAEACASEPVRVALEKVARDELDERALREAVEAEAQHLSAARRRG